MLTKVASDREKVLLCQQDVLARFGELALRSEDLDEILHEACRLVGEALGTDLSTVMELQHDEITLLVRAGVGWPPGIVGQVHVRAVDTSSEGHALQTGVPVISPDINDEDRFEYADFIKDAGVRAFSNVPIIGADGKPPYGILQVDSRIAREFTGSDISFLRSYANLLSGAVARLQLLAETRAAEAALRQSEARLRALVSASSEVLYSMSADWKEMRQLTGGGFLADTGTANPHWLTEYIPEQERPRVGAAIGQAIRTRTIFALEHQVQLADGGVGWTQSRAVPLLDPSGEVTEWFGTANDVTARREAEEALRGLTQTLEQQVEERTRERDRIWQVSQDMLGVSDERGIWISVNPAWTRILGWPAERIVGHSSEWLEHPEDRERTRAEVARLAAGHPTLEFENRFATKDGEYRVLSWRAVPADGLVYAVARDVTTEREAQRALNDFEDFTRLALSAIGGVGVWTYDVASDRFFCDTTISDLYGLDPRQGTAGIERAAFLANVHPEDVLQLQKVMAGGLERPGDLELEYRIRHPDGSIRWVLSRGHTYFSPAGQPTRRTGVGIETTKRRQLEEALRQSQKMEAVGQLTGGLAHDFNNLLTSITGSLELLQTRVSRGRPDSLARYIATAQDAAGRAAALTQRLLAFSRRQTLDPRPTDMNRLIADMEDLIRRTVGPAIAIEVIGDTGLPPALVDPNQLENALLNLCINARDAMPDGGKLTIRTGCEQVDERMSHELDVPAADYLTLSVTDSGSGMSPDVIARAFDPFFTTKPLGQGTGLGLSMIYGFAQQSGGQVRINSELGAGTTVSLYLPPYAGKTARVERRPDLPDAPQAEQGETVLVVDDEPTIRMLITETLEELGYTAIEAADGAAGLHILRSDARIDLLITDVGLPGGMNGRQMAEAGLVLRPELKVLFITGYAENAVLSGNHLEAGMQVMTKPFAMKVMALRIKTMIEA